MYFKDKIIWIIGASSGIGAALAKQLAKQHARLILTGRNIEALLAIQKECLLSTKYCRMLAADITDETSVTFIGEQACKRYGRLDVVIFSAGVSQRSLAINTPVEIDRKLMEINFFAPVIITKQLLPIFKDQQSGHIVIIGSMAGLMGFPMRTGYAAAKHALMGYFETLQVEHSLKDFYITIVNPGRINTNISMSAITANGSPHNKMDTGQLEGIPVEECADKILGGIRKKKKHLLIARGEKFLYWIKWFYPAMYYKIARKKGLH
jgi:dehydrogenase/reductase SDR family protein 7B